MKKYDQIHETVVKDIIDIYDTLKTISDEELGSFIKKHKGTRQIRSIANASNDLICVFPVLASRNISIENQCLISKAIEKNCVSMLQILFSAIQVSNAEDAFSYIRQFHTNINKSAKAMDLDDVIQIADMIMDSAVQVGAKVDYAIVEQVKRDMKNINYVLEDAVNPKSIAENFTCELTNDGKFVVQVESRQMLSEAGVDDDAYDDYLDYQNPGMVPRSAFDWIVGSRDRQRNRADDAEADLAFQVAAARNREKSYERGIAQRDNYIKNIEPELRKCKDTVSKQDKVIEKNKDEINDLNRRLNDKHRKDSSDIVKNNVENLSKQVLNNEYKKANELQPTMMIVNFKIRTPSGEYDTIESAVIGVKAKLYPISSEDMITHIVSKAKDANWITKLIKASTREISFFKDFLFAIDKAKVDALSMSKRGSANKMWKVLERRATKSKWNRLMARSNDATAITTIVLSQNEVDFIKKEFQIDVSDVYNTHILMDKYNLLGMVIVDESLEIGKFMWDTGEDLWETISFTNLERESSDNTYKKVVNLMTKHM